VEEERGDIVAAPGARNGRWGQRRELGILLYSLAGPNAN
jgi:hypothetical protein